MSSLNLRITARNPFLCRISVGFSAFASESVLALILSQTFVAVFIVTCERAAKGEHILFLKVCALCATHTRASHAHMRKDACVIKIKVRNSYGFTEHVQAVAHNYCQ